jgi:hypothetical protein
MTYIPHVNVDPYLEPDDDARPATLDEMKARIFDAGWELAIERLLDSAYAPGIAPEQADRLAQAFTDDCLLGYPPEPYFARIREYCDTDLLELVRDVYELREEPDSVYEPAYFDVVYDVAGDLARILAERMGELAQELGIPYEP